MKGSASQDDFKFKVSWPFCVAWSQRLGEMEGGAAMLQASTLLSEPWGTRLGMRQYDCPLEEQNQGLLVQ